MPLFIQAPAADFVGDVLTTLDNAVLQASPAFLVGYRAIVLSVASPTIAPRGTFDSLSSRFDSNSLTFDRSA